MLKQLEIPESFYCEETRSGHLVTRETKELWGIQLNMLYQFQQICEKYNLKYWADGGTLLGCARHGGYIPWDDDIDIMIMRDDYNKFVEVASKELEYPYFLQTWASDTHCLFSLAKIRNEETSFFSTKPNYRMMSSHGIFIDIFPFDNVSDDERERKQQLIASHNAIGNARLFKVLYENGHISQEEYNKKTLDFFKLHTDILIKENEHKTKRFTNLTVRPFQMRFLKYYSDNYDDIIYLPFEMLKLPCPRSYDKVLTDLFGNWHEFVKGTQLHRTYLVDTHKSYKDYIKESKS